MFALLAIAPGLFFGAYLSLAALLRFFLILPLLSDASQFDRNRQLGAYALTENIVALLSATTVIPSPLVSALWDFLGQDIPAALFLDFSAVRASFNREGLERGLSLSLPFISVYPHLTV